MKEVDALKLNKAAGILDIIASVLYFIAIFVLVGATVNEAMTTGQTSSTEMLRNVLLVFSAVCLVLHIVALVKSKPLGIKITGNILGIIGHAIYLLLGALFGWVAMILTILSAVFTLKDNKLPEGTK